MEITRERVFELRREGLPMWKIAEKIWDDNYTGSYPEMSYKECKHEVYKGGPHDEETMAELREILAFWKNRQKEYEDKILYKKGGVVDILLNSPDGPEYDAIADLMAGVAKRAADDFGAGYTESVLKLPINISLDSRVDYITAESYFLKGEYDRQVECISGDNDTPMTGKEVIKALIQQAIEGRWIAFSHIRFDTKKEAEKMIYDHPYYARNYILYSKKVPIISKKTHKPTKRMKTVWGLKLKEGVEEE